MFKPGDRVSVIEPFERKPITGIVTNRSRQPEKGWFRGSRSDSYWTIRRDDGITGGDVDNHGWVCVEEQMTLVDGSAVATFFD